MTTAIAAPVNGMAGDATPAPALEDSINASSAAVNNKRKREQDGEADATTADAPTEDSKAESSTPSASANGVSNGRQSPPAAPTTSTAGSADEKRLIKDYFAVLKSFDESEPPILKRPLPEPTSSEEPQAKRQKSDDNPSGRSIADKVETDAYALLDDLATDVASIVAAELAALEDSPAASAKKDDEIDVKVDSEDAEKDEKTSSEDVAAQRRAIAQINKFSEAAHALYRREAVYPKSGPLHGKNTNKMANGTSSDGEAVLTIFGNTPQPRQLFSSLPHAVPKTGKTGGDDSESESVEEIVREVGDLDLPNVSFTRIFAAQAPEKSGRVPTFGELFPSPRNLPPLQPPKAPKVPTKSTTLGFYHPELVEKSNYRSGSYCSQHVSAGQWLDYSNATPSSKAKTKQRERAQSLAGHKPSTTELEMSEMDSLFRGAFSSFAPSKDDTAALVSSGQISRMWWQRVGYRVFQRMVDNQLLADEETVDGDASTEVGDVSMSSTTVNGGNSALILDEEALQKTIEEWDDSLVDPSLEEVMGEKPETDKDVDEVLQDVSDLIITLASYQRNRNLTLPTSQDRFSADPVNADMLRNGTLAQQPSEEEMVTYQTLKAQLSLIIQSLPPYAVARLNSDKLAELNISTKIQVRAEEYHGVMEEEESVYRARQAAQAQAQAAANSPQRAPAHRAASVSYGTQFATPSRSPMPAGNYYQTPGRVGQQHRPSAAALPPHVRATPQGQPQYRPSPNGYGGYPASLPKGQPPAAYRGQPQGVPAYPGTPGQPGPAHMSPQRTVSQPQPGAYGTPVVQPPGTPQQQFRYPPGGYGATPGSFSQQQPLPAGTPQPGIPQQQQQRLPQQPPFTPNAANGGNYMQQQLQQRPIQAQHAGSPQQRMAYAPGQVPPAQLQQQAQQQAVNRLGYGTMPGQMPGMMPTAGQRHFSVGGSPAVTTAGSPMGQPALGPVGYHTVMDQPQQQRLMEQARARASAHERSLGFADKMSHGGVGPMGGLAGIGLGGAGAAGVDVAKLAAARANIPGGMPMNGLSSGRQGPPPQQAQPQLGQPMVPQPQFSQGMPSPMASSVSPAPSGGFQRPPQ